MKKLIICMIMGAALAANGAEWAFLFEDGTFDISSNPFAYTEREARLDNFEIESAEVVDTVAKPQWIVEAEALFTIGMETNGFGSAPWTNLTFESVGMTLLQKSVFAPTEEERNAAARWKEVLESVYKTLLEEHNRYRTAAGSEPIGAIWDYPLGSALIWSNSVQKESISWDGKVYYRK